MGMGRGRGYSPLVYDITQLWLVDYDTHPRPAKFVISQINARGLISGGPTDPARPGTPEAGQSQGAALGALQPGGSHLLPADRRRVAIPHGCGTA